MTDRFSPGLYAARMSGTLPAEDQEMLEEKGYLIRGRDVSVPTPSRKLLTYLNCAGLNLYI